METKNKIEIKAEIELPHTPNFIRLSNGSAISIKDMSEKTLREIGALWVEELVKKSKKPKI